MNDKIFKAIDKATKLGYAVRFDKDPDQSESLIISIIKGGYFLNRTISTLVDYKCADSFLGSAIESLLEEAPYWWDEKRNMRLSNKWS